MRTALNAAILCLAISLAAPSLADDNDWQEGPPYELGAVYVADALANVHGGLREGSAWVDYLELAAAFDAGRAFGIGDLVLFASVVRANSPTFSDRYVGDAMIVSNIDSQRALRALEAWLDWGFEAPRGKGSVRIGLYDLNSEFDTTESRGLFINSAYGIGQELAQTGRNGPSIYPVTALAARLAWAPAEPWLLKLAVVDGVPGDPGDTHRTRWHLSRSEGALLITEVTAAAGPVAQFSLGHWRYTERFAAVGTGEANAAPQFERDNRGTYVTAEFRSRTGTGGAPRWNAFVRAGEANDRVNVFERHLAAGIVVDWPWPGVHGSRLGLAASEARVGADYRTAQRRIDNDVGRYERNVELTWRCPIGEHLVLQPDVQYIVNPGAERRIPDAWVVGLRVELAVSR